MREASSKMKPLALRKPASAKKACWEGMASNSRTAGRKPARRVSSTHKARSSWFTWSPARSGVQVMSGRTPTTVWPTAVMAASSACLATPVACVAGGAVTA